MKGEPSGNLRPWDLSRAQRHRTLRSKQKLGGWALSLGATQEVQPSQQTFWW